MFGLLFFCGEIINLKKNVLYLKQFSKCINIKLIFLFKSSKYTLNCLLFHRPLVFRPIIASIYVHIHVYFSIASRVTDRDIMRVSHFEHFAAKQIVHLSNVGAALR